VTSQSACVTAMTIKYNDDHDDDDDSSISADCRCLSSDDVEKRRLQMAFRREI